MSISRKKIQLKWNIVYSEPGYKNWQNKETLGQKHKTFNMYESMKKVKSYNNESLHMNK